MKLTSFYDNIINFIFFISKRQAELKNLLEKIQEGLQEAKTDVKQVIKKC